MFYFFHLARDWCLRVMAFEFFFSWHSLSIPPPFFWLSLLSIHLWSSHQGSMISSRKTLLSPEVRDLDLLPVRQNQNQAGPQPMNCLLHQTPVSWAENYRPFRCWTTSQAGWSIACLFECPSLCSYLLLHVSLPFINVWTSQSFYLSLGSQVALYTRSLLNVLKEYKAAQRKMHGSFTLLFLSCLLLLQHHCQHWMNLVSSSNSFYTQVLFYFILLLLITVVQPHPVIRKTVM